MLGRVSTAIDALLCDALCRGLLLPVYNDDSKVFRLVAPVAQRIEQRFPKPCATGSSPVRGAIPNVVLSSLLSVARFLDSGRSNLGSSFQRHQ